MNGEGMAKAVQGMNVDEKLVFLISEVGNLKTAVVSHAKVVSQAMTELNDMKVAQAKTPDYCNNIVTNFDKRLGALESLAAGRKAVNKALFGASGLSMLGIGAIILKLCGVF